MTHKEKALDYFARGYHCSQSVLAAFADECGLTETQALKLGGCFGSGMRKGEVCGACTGALMVLGALYGQYDKSDPESKLLADAVNDEMMDGFKKLSVSGTGTGSGSGSGTYICNDLLGCDITTEEGVQEARNRKLFTELCPTLVANAVDLLEGIISRH